MDYIKFNISKPVRFISGGTFSKSNPWKHMQRISDSFEIMIGVNGKVGLYMGKNKYILEPNKILLLLPGIEHGGTDITQSDVRFLWMHFLPRSKYSIVDENEAIKSLLSKKKEDDIKDAYIPIFSTCNDEGKTSILFKQLIHMNSSSYFTSYAMDYMITSLIIEIVQQNIYEYVHNREVQDRGFYTILEWMSMNSENRISLQSIAEEFNYSKEYFSRLFKRNSGMTVHNYINYLRLEKAKKLLITSDMPIKGISSQVGYCDEKYFMTQFKKYENITATEYRNSYDRMHYNNT